MDSWIWWTGLYFSICMLKYSLHTFRGSSANGCIGVCMGVFWVHQSTTTPLPPKKAPLCISNTTSLRTKLIDFLCATQANILWERPNLWSVNHLAALILPLCKQALDSDKRNQALMGYLLGFPNEVWREMADGLFSIFYLWLVLHHFCQDGRQFGIWSTSE